LLLGTGLIASSSAALGGAPLLAVLAAFPLGMSLGVVSLAVVALIHRLLSE